MIETREKVREGIESLDRGEGVDGETVVNDLLAKLRQAKEGSSLASILSPVPPFGT